MCPESNLLIQDNMQSIRNNFFLKAHITSVILKYIRMAQPGPSSTLPNIGGGSDGI